MAEEPDTKLGYSPPPRYSEARDDEDIKDTNQGYGGWLVQRTSIHVESTAIDSSSLLSGSVSASETSGWRNTHHDLLRKNERQRRSSTTSPRPSQAYDSTALGSQVIIEAAQPLKTEAERRIQLKGLEQAASLKRWIGSGQPAEAWGKLMKVR